MDLKEIPKNRELTYIGNTTFRDKNVLFGIKRKDRRQHVYILGKSGTGKSALMFNMIIQNIENGDGVCMVDPHGENVEAILSAIPPHRMKDVVYFNPADTEHHIGFNVLELVDPKYKHLVASGLMGIFTKIWANAWSARMEYILNNAILALLDTPGTTLLGIPRMLVDKDYRQKIITNLKDPVIKAFWVHEYEAWQDKFRNEAIAPIQNKVGQFLSTSIIRNALAASGNMPGCRLRIRFNAPLSRNSRALGMKGCAMIAAIACAQLMVSSNWAVMPAVACGNGVSLSVASVMMASVPSEPMISRVRS